jgi:hypothetical protein
MKKSLSVPLMFLLTAVCFADETEAGDLSIIPLLNYEFVSLERQQYHAPGSGLILLYGEQQPSLSEKWNNLMIGFFYTSYIFKENQPDYAALYHDFAFVIEKKFNRHVIRGVFSTGSDKPVYGGLQTTYSSFGYGYEFIRKENMYLISGLTLGVTDFGFDLPNGGTWPLLPASFIRFGYNSSIINIEFDWPELKIAIPSETRIRMTGTLSFNTHEIQNLHDLRFDSILWYRFFPNGYKPGDFAGIGAGIKKEGMDFRLGEKGREYDINHYSVFGILDASFIKISGGYIFYGKEFYDSGYSGETGTGFFAKAELLYRF